MAAGAEWTKQLFWVGAGIVVPKTRRAAAKMLAAGSEVWAQYTLWAEEEATTKGDSYGSLKRRKGRLDGLFPQLA